jgi:hypothetical protein
MVASHWVKVLDAEASVLGILGVVLESSVAALETEGVALALCDILAQGLI